MKQRTNGVDLKEEHPASDDGAGLPTVLWEQVHEPGAYIELATGDLYRFGADALAPRTTPVIIKESITPALLFQISKDPAIAAHEARIVCARHNIQPNF